MTSVISESIAMQNATARQEALNKQINGTNNELGQDMFLKLMLEQLKYQDPLEPMSNQEFLAQQAQFTQVSKLQKLNSSISQNNSLTQAVSLIGKEVTVTNPNDSTKTITGIVESATIDSDGAAITMGGITYPTSLIKDVKGTAPTETTTGTAETATATNTISEKLDNGLSSLSKIAQSAGYIISKLDDYLN